MKIQILSRKEIFNDRLKIESAEISLTKENGDKHVFTRMRLNRQDAVAVLIYHKDKDAFILIRQYRFPAEETHELFLEIPAGKIEDDKDPVLTAVREIEEETGYVIPEENFVFLSACYASPGYSTEKFHLYYAEIDNRTKKKRGGGLEEEGEFIETEEIRAKDFFEGIDNNLPMDAKTLLAGWIVRKKFFL
jgi:nudix-type nucleoside diphosphatase (YffH/AdpP family)